MHLFPNFHFDEQKKFAEILVWYVGKKLKTVGATIEKVKNLLVDLLLYKRGKFSRIFVHGGMVFIILAVLISAPLLAQNFPLVAGTINRVQMAQASSSLLRTETGDIATEISEKPRDKVEEHQVQEGETLSSIAEKYNVSMDSIKWLNTDISDFETLTLGQTLKIPPVSGIVHTVESGDTVYSLAKTYKTNAQKIVDFPFNQFANDETFDLIAGAELMIPDGVMPEAPAPTYYEPQFFAGALGTPVGGGTGQFSWPTTGYISQYFGWYHTGVDIADPSAPLVTAAEGGRVVLAEQLAWGYGWHIIIDHGNGFQTLYGHLQEMYVGPDPGRNQVVKGQAIGRMGSTGRSTGTHLHFEIRYNGAFQNPLSYLK